MSTSKDLVEAHAFSRRRLVTAFVSGAPGGREVEPARPGRTLFGGVAISVLLLAGGAAAGHVSGPPDNAWLRPGIVIAKETGAGYIITEESGDPELRPLANNTSARLILGAEPRVSMVKEADINARGYGVDVGIFGAPASLPPAGHLIDEGWTACTGAGLGIKVNVAEEPEVEELPGHAFVVQEEDDGDYFLIAQTPAELGDPQALRFRLPGTRTPRDNFLLAVGDLAESEEAVEVPGDWLKLFPEGPPLTVESFAVERRGATAGYLDFTAEVGEVLVSGGEHFLVGETDLETLTPFAHQLYAALTGRGPREVPAVPGRGARTYPAEWPTNRLGGVAGEHCGVLMSRVDRTPTVLLAGNPVGEASAGMVPAGEHTAHIEPARGAFVLSAGLSAPQQRTPFVIGATGDRHQLVGPETVARLGYAEHEVRVVPDTWLELFGCGVSLSRDEALRAPDPTARPTCSAS